MISGASEEELELANVIADKLLLQKENQELKKQLEEYKSPIKYFKYANKNVTEENKQLKDNWNKLKEYLINDIKYWEEQEKEWIKLGFIKFGGEANNKIIFEKILNKMQELEQGSDNNDSN